MKLRGKRFYAQNGASVKRGRRRRASRREDPELKAMRNAITAQKRAEGHPGYPAPSNNSGSHGRSAWRDVDVISIDLDLDDFDFDEG